jgi:hypothetical protein
VLLEAKKRGIKLALHIAEVCCAFGMSVYFLSVWLQVDGMISESQQLLSIPADRIGHGLFLHPAHGGNEDLLQLTHKSKIPIGN